MVGQIIIAQLAQIVIVAVDAIVQAVATIIQAVTVAIHVLTYAECVDAVDVVDADADVDVIATDRDNRPGILIPWFFIAR